MYILYEKNSSAVNTTKITEFFHWHRYVHDRHWKFSVTCSIANIQNKPLFFLLSLLTDSCVGTSQRCAMKSELAHHPPPQTTTNEQTKKNTHK